MTIDLPFRCSLRLCILHSRFLDCPTLFEILSIDIFRFHFYHRINSLRLYLLRKEEFLMKQRIASLLLALTLILLPTVSAFAADPAASEPAPAAQTQPAVPESADAAQHSYTYIALGDSITAGIGLSDTPYEQLGNSYDMTANYHGYSQSSYVGYVADQLGLDREHVTNLGLPGITSADIVDLVEQDAMPARNAYGHQYSVPGLRQQLQNADLITVQVGSNDTVMQVIMSIGKATNQKSTPLLIPLLTGAMREPSLASLNALYKGLKSLSTMNCDEWKALCLLLNPGIQEICDSTYADTTANLQKSLAELRALNPHAQILVLGYYSPLEIFPAWDRHFTRLNQHLKELAPQYNAVYVPISCTMTADDGHPTKLGHRYIGRQILKAVQK